jgi:hypothetical protein
MPGVKLIVRYVLKAILESNTTNPFAGTPASQNRV